MAGMDALKGRGGDTTKKLEGGVEDITGMADDFKGVKDQLQDLPDGLDADIVSAIKDAEDAARSEAAADIDATQRSVIDQAKAAAESIRGDVQTKISENKTAQGKLDSINSKYGKGAVDNAKRTIAENTRMGEDLIRDLENAARAAEQRIADAKGKLG